MDIETQLRQEFESLKCKKPSIDCLSKFKAACCPQNMGKNRYYNVLPNEESRVLLRSLGDSDCDYINANFVGCEKIRRKYILTQAPLPNTMNDMWRMIWQERAPVVVCLTKLSEGEVQKAHKYWPDEGHTMQFGKVLVKQTKSQLVSTIAIRYFDVWLEGDFMKENVLQVTHMHYLDWPDHGTPLSTQPIRLLANMVTEKAGTNGPVVAHCSAGVGRAGTFVTIHMALHQLENSLYQIPSFPSILKIWFPHYGANEKGQCKQWINIFLFTKSLLTPSFPPNVLH